ncbi:MAG: M20/M25/M40 family metallo-hydrolase, partial [Syntrophales bacterium LBB04]|nr:M20/M25/M40 family metallo-hydrolase [Syntrophales bacterium LBB04]
PHRCEVDIIGTSGEIERMQGEKVIVNQITRVVSGKSINSLIEVMTGLYRSLESFVVTLEPSYAAGFETPVTVYNLGVVSSYADHLSFSLDLRLLPGQDFNKIVGWMQKSVDEMSEKHPEIEIDGGLSFRIDPMQTDPDCALVKTALMAAAGAGLGGGLATMSAASEGSVYSNSGVKTILFGPGPVSGAVHHPNEYVELSALAKAADFYEALITRLCM